MDKLIFVATLKQKYLNPLWLEKSEIRVYRSKGLLAHLLKRKHFIAAKYLDYLPDIIKSPDYAGISNNQIELVKCFKDNIFISIKLDANRRIYYVATLYEVSYSKIESYCKSGRLCRIKQDD